MKRLSRDASLHEKTVQDLAVGRVEMPKRARSKNRALAAWGMKVDPAVLKEARRLAHGDMSRVVIHKDGSITVRG